MRFALALVLITTSVAAQELPWQPSTSSLSEWEQVDHGVEGIWSLSRGVIMQDSQDAGVPREGDWTALIGGGHGWTDYTFRATVKTHGEGLGDTVGLIFGWQDEDNHWRVRLERSWTGGESWRVLERVVSGEVEELARAEGMSERDAVELEVSTWHGRIAVLEDRIEILRHTSEGPVGGRVGLLSLGSGFSSFRRMAAWQSRVRDSYATGPWISQVTDRSVTICVAFPRPVALRLGLMATSGSNASRDFSEIVPSGPSPRNRWEVTLENLDPSTRYAYGLFAEGDHISPESSHGFGGSSFQTAPSDPSTPFRLGVWGDNRTDPAAHERVAEALADEEPDFAVNVGDVVTDGRKPHEWREEFFEPARRLLASTPTYIAIGNHERDDDLFYELFAFPGRENWYAVTYGCMRLIVLDTNQPVRPNSPQHDWLLEEIESEAFQSAAWQIAAFHHPPFTEGWDNPDYDGEPRVREHLWPVLRDAGVDLLLMGHTHDYERGTLDGVVHVITGGGGSPLDHWVQNWDFIEVYESAYQYCLLDISPERIDLVAKTPEGRVIDEFTLERGEASP